ASTSSARRKKGRSCRSSRPASPRQMPLVSTIAAWSCATSLGPAGCARRAGGGRATTILTASSASFALSTERASRLRRLGERRVQVDDRPVRVLQLRIALPPERVPRFLVRRRARLEELPVDPVDLLRGVATKCAAGCMTVRRPLPVRIERADDVFSVERIAHSSGKGRLDVLLVLGALGEIEAEPAIQRDRPPHIADDDAENAELAGLD